MYIIDDPHSSQFQGGQHQYLSPYERQLETVGHQNNNFDGMPSQQSVGQASSSSQPSSRKSAQEPRVAGVDYPEPSVAWLEEVKQLQGKVARLKLREQDLNQRLKHRYENMEAASADIPDILTAKFLEVESTVTEKRKTACDQHAELISRDMQALSYISNERCNALNKLFELKLQQLGAGPGGVQRRPGTQATAPEHLEKRISDLEEDNYSLRRRLQDEDSRRSTRETELKNICIEQAKEIEDLRRIVSELGPGRAFTADLSPTDHSWSGIEVADIQLSDEKRQAVLDTHGQGVVRVTRVSGQAARSGLKVGDTISWINTQHRTMDAADFHNALGKLRPGDAATLTIRRGRSEKEVTLTCE